MRFAIQFQFITILLICMLSTKHADAQTYSNTPKVGESPPAWLISEEPTYDIVKQKFIEHYGTDQKEWPFFIQEIKRLTNNTSFIILNNRLRRISIIIHSST